MVSIPHYEDLSAQAIYDSLDLMWWPSEKLDGSYLAFGLDDQGKFYSQRKGGVSCHVVEDYPEECWASTYRIGHTLGAMLVESLVSHNLIKAGQSFGAELLKGNLPNTIPYRVPPEYDGLMFITSMNFDMDSAIGSILQSFKSRFNLDVFKSYDGIEREAIPHEHVWKIQLNPQMPRLIVESRLRQHANQFRRILDHWFPQDSAVEGFSVIEVLDISLAKKHPNCGSRNWNDLRKELVKERDALKSVMLDLTLLFKETAFRALVSDSSSSVGAGSFKEGAVINSNQGLFKIVDREMFSGANHFTHLVKYWLVGGRRPARPCFLSRTKDWPKEKRLARLDVLLARYISNRQILHYTLNVAGHFELLTYSGQLHQRTLNMFSDTRKRIQDGR